jgi:hypothetical protein
MYGTLSYNGGIWDFRELFHWNLAMCDTIVKNKTTN